MSRWRLHPFPRQPDEIRPPKPTRMAWEVPTPAQVAVFKAYRRTAPIPDRCLALSRRRLTTGHVEIIRLAGPCRQWVVHRLDSQGHRIVYDRAAQAWVRAPYPTVPTPEAASGAAPSG